MSARRVPAPDGCPVTPASSFPGSQSAPGSHSPPAARTHRRARPPPPRSDPSAGTSAHRQEAEAWERPAQRPARWDSDTVISRETGLDRAEPGWLGAHGLTRTGSLLPRRCPGSEGSSPAPDAAVWSHRRACGCGSPTARQTLLRPQPRQAPGESLEEREPVSTACPLGVPRTEGQRVATQTKGGELDPLALIASRL